MFAQWKFQIWLTATVIAVAAFISVFPDERVVHAQGADNDYVDVELILESPHEQATPIRRLKITILNHGARTAYDVEVVVNVVYPEDSSHFNEAPTVPVGVASLENDGTTLRWTIPEFGGLQRAEVNTLVRDRSTVAPIFDHAGETHEFFGELTTSSFENDLHQKNNTDRVWSSTQTLDVFNASQAKGDYAVSVSVDERNPSPGSTVNFTITAIHARTIPYSVIDQKVAIELTEGLADDPEGTISYDPATRAASVIYSNGVFNIGTRVVTASPRIPQHSVTLPIRVSSDAIVNQQCLTATITGNPPPGPYPGDDDISDNVAKVCLGEPPDENVVLTSGHADLFTWYDCVSKSSYPCSNEDSLELVVLGMSASAASDAPYEIFEPGNVIVHVPDPGGRNTSSDSDSSALVWSTGLGDDPATTGDDGFVRQGVYIGDNATLLAPGKWGVEPSGETGERTGNLVVNVSGPGAASAWGIYDTGMRYEAFEFLSEATNGEMYNDVWYLQYQSNVYVEFSALGTYTLTFSATASLNAGTPSNTADDTAHTATGTYTFHVGPVAELEVRDGDGSAHVAVDRNALTMLAVNNGPSHSPGARVTGLPKDAEVIHISQGSYDGVAGVWKIGELEDRDRLKAAGRSEHAMLVLGATTEETADVTIENSVAYTVCIGSHRSTLDQDNETDCEAVTGASWHTGTVYDYNSGNNTAKITAVKGTGGGGPSEARFAATPVLTWGAVPHVNDWPVHRYQVQYLNGDNWLDLAEVPGDQTYFADSDARSKPSYRVRALNEAGVPGFWSRPASQVAYRQALPPSPPLNVTAVAGHAGEVVVSWELPVDDGGSPITYYQVQWSRSGTGGWSNACRSEGPSDLSCTQTGIPAGETRYYRVAAYAGGLGDWSDLAVATTIPGVPSAPRSLSASRAPQPSGGETILAIRLNWSAPATDNGSPIYRYHIEYVDYDQSAGRCGTDWKYQGSDPSVHSNNDSPTRQFIDTGEYEWIGLEPGAHRCYRVSAENSAGEGPFSNVARASAGGEGSA